jgi:Tfp pilus assembly protein PilX
VRGLIRRIVAGEPRGMAFITTLFVLFAVGMMLVGFVFMMRNEAFLASRTRNAAIALDLAEAGAQEGLARMSLYTIVPGTSTFNNSLAVADQQARGTSSLSPAGALNNQPCAPSTQGNSVTYQAPLTWSGQNLSIYPVCSTATFGSTSLTSGVQRTVRAYVLGSFKPGATNVIFTPQVSYNSDVRYVSGDSYSWGFINFQSNNAVICAAAASATNLPPPQVFAGTYIFWSSPIAGCGASGANTYYPYECASNSMSEVAPTNCARTATLPYHFHPMVPRAMPQDDFIAVLKAVTLPPIVTLYQATQNSGTTLISFPTPASYPAAYANKVMLVTSTTQFCVNKISNTVVPFGAGPACPNLPANLYGDPACSPAPCSNITRYLDWALIVADTTSRQASTFFQPPLCTAPCPLAGLQNGIRYIPIPPDIQPQALACKVNVNPGTNVVDYWGMPNPGCSPPITTINSGSVTFTGTKTNPESLIILNAAGDPSAVTIVGSPAPSPTVQFSCSPASYFDTYNWGQILATGDIKITTNFVFSGILFSKGNITFNADAAIWGAIFSPPVVANQQTSFLTNNNATVFCGATQVTVLNPLQMNFTQFAWQDPTQPGPSSIR